MKLLKNCFILLVMSAVCNPVASLAAKTSTLLLIPRDNGPVKEIGLDVGNRFPTLLLNYKTMPNGTLSLHGWSGSEWVNITLESYREGAFFKSSPASALIVVPEGSDVPDYLIPNDAWCPSVYSISTTKIRPLIHLIGRHYDFKYKDWKWFADNYHLPINSINPEQLNIAWYNRHLSDNLKSKTGDELSDLAYLQVVRIPQVLGGQEMAEQATGVSTNESAVESGVEEVGGTGEEINDNPLTNDVPEAVVVDAADTNKSMSSELPDSVDEEATSGNQE